MWARDVQTHLHWLHHKNVQTSAPMLNSTSMLATTGSYVLLSLKVGDKQLNYAQYYLVLQFYCKIQLQL
jgi:hypothetical protein